MSKLILGTVQFGLAYGINNQTGKPTEESVFELLDYAYAAGVRQLDTAAAYGNAVALIGKYHSLRAHRFDIITKFKATDAADFSWSAALNSALDELKVQSLEGLMFHSFGEYKDHPEQVQYLAEAKAAGKIKNIGVSVYTNEELNQIAEDPAIDLVQLPFNMLDNTHQRQSALQKAKDAGKIIHTRSVFLQGLFFKNPHTFPDKLIPLLPYVERIQHLALRNQIPLANLALQYAAANPLIDKVLIGVDNLTQLQANLSGLRAKEAPLNVIQTINRIAVPDAALLNPVNWP